MNITHYYFDIEYFEAKNQLQYEQRKYLYTLARTIILAEDLPEAKIIIIQELLSIEKKNSQQRGLSVIFVNPLKNSVNNFKSDVIINTVPCELKHMSRLPYRSLSNN